VRGAHTLLAWCTILPCTETSDVPGLNRGLQLAVPSHRRELQTAVSASADLTSALANTAVSRIVLASGTYNLIAELSITRSVILEAAAGATVTLNAQASSSSQRRVLNINPGSSGVVQLNGLRITGGHINNSVRAQVPIAPMGDSRFAFCSQGGGVYVSSGTVTITSSSIYGNIASNVRAHLHKFPMPPRETHVWLVVCRAVVSLSHPAQSQSSTPKFITIKLLVLSCVLMLKSSHRPDGNNSDALDLSLARSTAANSSINYSLYAPQRLECFPSPRWENC